jgi:hypothetical protein
MYPGGTTIFQSCDDRGKGWYIKCGDPQRASFGTPSVHSPATDPDGCNRVLLRPLDGGPRQAQPARGVQGFADIREFLRSIRPEDRTKVQVAWRLETVDFNNVSIGERSEELRINSVTHWIGTAIDRHDWFPSSGSTSIRNFMGYHRHANPLCRRWVGGAPRFYCAGKIDPSTRRTTSVVVNGPLQVVFWKEWQKQDWEKESDERCRRIVRM